MDIGHPIGRFEDGLFGEIGSNGKIHGNLLSNAKFSSSSPSAMEYYPYLGFIVGCNNSGKIWQCRVTSGSGSWNRMSILYADGGSVRI